MYLDELNNLAYCLAIQIAVQSQDKSELFELASAFRQLGNELAVISVQRAQQEGNDPSQENIDNLTGLSHK